MAITKVTSGGISDIAAAVEGASDSNKFTDADHTKLNAIEASATTDQTKSDIEGLGIDVPAANLTGTLPDARFPSALPAISGANLTGLSASDSTKLSLAGGTMTGNIVMADDTSIGISDSAERIEFDGAGDINILGASLGIGTTTPNRMLTIEGDGNEPDISLVQLDNTNDNFNEIRFLSVGSDDSTRRVGASFRGVYRTHNATSPTTDLTFSTRNSSDSLAERMRIASDGKVGIGTDSPTNKLHVKSTGAEQINLETTGGATTILAIALKNSANTWQIENGRASNVLSIRSSTGGETIRSHANGVTAFNSGIALGVGLNNTASNVLDDYEEGSWTPTLNNTGGTPSYTWQKGNYVKVGAWVWLTANVKFTVTPSGATQQAVGGLPFANRNGAGQYTAAMFTPKQGFNYDGDGLTADIYDGSTIAYVEEYDAGTGGNGGSLLANEIGTTVEFRFSTFYTTT